MEAYRANKANEYINDSEDQEPPYLYSADVLYKAKKQYNDAKYFDKDIFKSVEIMKYGKYATSIQSIGYDPFFIHFCTNLQLKIYQKLCSKDKITISIDSTGSLVKKINRYPGHPKRHIFLHSITVPYRNTHIPVTHMLSEESHTLAIAHWLMMWKRTGAPEPQVCVADWSRALLNAASLAFNNIPNICEYADALKSGNIPKVYIRLDVAHTIKKYSMFLKNCCRPVKTFYLASLGALLISESMEDCQEILKDIFTVCLADTDGKNVSGMNTMCKVSRKKLMAKIAGKY